MAINILGSGYVGLTLGIYIANQGSKVNMIDIDESKIEKLQSGKSPVHETGIQEALDFAIESNNIFFTTDTNISSSVWIIAISYFPGKPDEFIDVIKNIKFDPGVVPTIMIRTTIPSGFIKDDIIPSLEEHFGGNVDEKFHIVSAPERSLSGNAINELRDLPQVIGGTRFSTEIAKNTFESVGIEVIALPSFEASELVKSFTNFSRLVQFNLSNYLGALCSIHSVNEKDLLRAIKHNYPRMDFLDVSGPGVGGFCLPKDSLVMHDSLKKNEQLKDEFKEIINFPYLQYELNENIIKYNASQIDSCIQNQSKILALGIAFKGEPHTDDTRDSVGLKIIDYLLSKDHDVRVFDTSVSKKKVNELGYEYTEIENLESFETILFLNNDRRYNDIVRRTSLNLGVNKNYTIYDPWKIFLNHRKNILEKSINLAES